MQAGCLTYALYAWANSLPLERKVTKSTKVTPDKKLAHAQSMLKAAMTREKRATTLRKKWETKVKYYNNRISKEGTCCN